MIIVDTALQKRLDAGNPVRVALVGAGYMARCIALQIITAVPGMRLVAVANRTLVKAEKVYEEAGIADTVRVRNVAELEQAIAGNKFAVTDDALLVCQAGPIEAVIEVTGDVEFGTRVTFEAIRNGKHLISLSAEVDASVGPILKTYADRAGVIYTYTDGDEPGVGMNLVRLVDSMGYKPMLVGQLKGFLNHYRNPETQTELATKLQQNPAVLASFADGSKLALEASIVGNATGFVPQVRGMHGYECKHVKDLLGKYSMKDFENGGLVDFVLGAEPHTGAFVICHNDHPVKRKLMAYLKMGDGPFYMFYTPYHLPPLQLPHTLARAVLFRDATITPKGSPVCDTIAHAKRDIKAGERLDGMGGFTCYGMVDRYDTCTKENFLPIAISTDCRALVDMPKDQPIRYADVALPPDRLCDRLRVEQAAMKPGAA